MKRPTATILAALLMLLPALSLAEEEILIGLIPEENIFRQFERHKPLSEYLTKKLGTKVRFTILSKYGDIIDRFVSRNMDGAFFGDFTAVLAEEQLGTEPVAKPVNLDGKTTVKSYIFARKDSGIKTVSDMKGKRAAFVDKATASGYLFALSYLKQNGVSEPEGFFEEYYFTGSHDSAINAVLDGRADIGSAKSRIFNKLVEKDPFIKEELNILAESDELPDTTLCLRADLDIPTKNFVKNILINMKHDPDGQKVLQEMEIREFTGAGMEDFKNVLNVMKKAGIEIKKYKYR